MPRGRPPSVQQIKAIAEITRRGGSYALSPVLTEKLIKNGYIDTTHAVTEKGKEVLKKTDKSLAVLLDYDNLAYQANVDGYQLLPETANDFFQKEALKRGFSMESSEKWCFFTTKTGGDAFLSPLSLADGFDALGYTVVVTQPVKNRADERMIGVISLLLHNPKIKTVFFASHDNGFNPIIETLEKRKKKVVRISVDDLTFSGAKVASEAVLFRPLKEEDRFKEEINDVIDKIILDQTDLSDRFQLIRDTVFTVIGVIAVVATPESRIGYRGILQYIKKVFPSDHELEKWQHRIVVEVLGNRGMISRHPSDKEVKRLKEEEVVEVKRFWVFNPEHSTSVKLLAEFEKRNQQLDSYENERKGV